jgi:N-glycosylase/DNA lyase
MITELKKTHSRIKLQIESRLDEFKRNTGGEKFNNELFFCLLTPQSEARRCWETVKLLKRDGVIYKSSAVSISKMLSRVRFKNKKAKYLIETRKKIMKGNGASLESIIKRSPDFFLLRDWLVKNINGMGYKEASHFLRNIGKGENIAILDRHILKNLKKLGVIQHIPSSMTRNRYMEIEQKMRKFSEEIGISLSHLDLLFWYMEKGEIFK